MKTVAVKDYTSVPTDGRTENVVPRPTLKLAAHNAGKNTYISSALFGIF